MLMERFSLAPGSRLLRAQSPQRRRDGDHLPRAERLRERVRDPVDRPLRAPGDEPQALPVVVQLELAPVDPADVGRVVEDGRRLPGRPLDPVVLADAALRDDEPVRAVELAALVADLVDVRLRLRVARAVVAQRREEEGEARAPRADDRLVLALTPRGLEPGDASAAIAAAARRAAGGPGRPRGRPWLRGRLGVEELVQGPIELALGGEQVVRTALVVDPEGDLADGLAAREEHELEQREDVRRAPEALVGVRVAGEDRRELLAPAVVEQAAGAGGVAQLAQEVLLARRAHEVVVAVAVADVVEGVLAMELLVARVDVDRGVVLAVGVVVEVVAVDVDVDAADVVDDLAEAAEVDLDDVVDLERLAGLGEQALDRPDRQPRAAQLVRRVDAVAVVARDVGLEVARDRHHRGRVSVRVQPHEQDRVRPRLEPELPVAVALVGAQDHDRLRLAGLGAVDLGDLDRRPALPLDHVDDRPRLEEARGGDRAGGEQYDQHARRRGPLEQAGADLGGRFGAHESPPSTARRPPGAWSGRSSPAGRWRMKSPSAWR